MMDETDRALINDLQSGMPVARRPFAEIAARHGLAERDIVARVKRLLDTRVLSRFGPLYDAERLGGGLTLAAMAVPPGRFEEVAAIVNALPEVAHNYEREHRLNMWFVVATERPEHVAAVLKEIKDKTGLPVFDFPKAEEFFLDLRLTA
ncbi:MAG: AsnC family transcriptional regulator [Alphaproteobacteria bacterium]